MSEQDECSKAFEDWANIAIRSNNQNRLYPASHKETWKACWQHRQKEIDKLRSQNAKLKECVEFYADEDNWRNSYEEDGWLYVQRIDPDWMNLDRDRDILVKSELEFIDCSEGQGTYFVAGKKARQALKELENE